MSPYVEERAAEGSNGVSQLHGQKRKLRKVFQLYFYRKRNAYNLAPYTREAFSANFFASLSASSLSTRFRILPLALFGISSKKITPPVSCL